MEVVDEDGPVDLTGNKKQFQQNLHFLLLYFTAFILVFFFLFFLYDLDAVVLVIFFWENSKVLITVMLVLDLIQSNLIIQLEFNQN